MAATYATIGDPVTSVASLINDNWSGAIASGVGSTPTTIKATWEAGKTNLKNGDVIRCYEVSGSHDLLGVGKGVDKGTSQVSIDISTATSREQLRKLYSGVVSILRGAKAGNVTKPTGYAAVNILSRVDLSDKNRRWYRYVLDCEVTSFEVVN
tara:strand:+ start:836 stop:1294 length:459 start_codon:yes stop_codon:yes gene_type:complete